VLELLVSLAVWAVAVALLLASLPLLALLRLLAGRRDPARRLPGRLFHGIGRVMVRANPLWTVRLDRAAAAAFREPSLVVANHESDADTFLAACLPWDLKFLAKASLYNLPVMGWAMRLVGDIGVVRDDAGSRAAARAAMRGWLERGVSVVVFPEGTRSRDAELLPFRDGAFRLAIELGVAVQPVVFAGTRRAMPPGGWGFRRAVLGLRVLPPVPTAGLSPDDAAALAVRVRQQMVEARAAWRRDLGPG
jgi:1-acyl-sn-glycerol-3-phosphate acyltransferase